MTRANKNHNPKPPAAPVKVEDAAKVQESGSKQPETTPQGSSLKGLDDETKSELTKTDQIKQRQEAEGGVPDSGPMRPEDTDAVAPRRPEDVNARRTERPRPEDEVAQRSTSAATSPSTPAWTPTVSHVEQPKPDADGRPPAEQDPAPTPEATADERARLAYLEDAYEDLKIQKASEGVKLAQLTERLDEMAAMLGKRKEDGPSTITIHGTSVCQKTFAKNWAKRKAGLDPKDAPRAGRTYRVTPAGQSAKRGMPIATITNAADGGDAKAMYALRLGQPGESIMANVELLTDSAEA